MVKRIITLLFMVFVFGAAQATESFKPVPVTTLSLSEAWQRQQVILTVEIPTPDEFARLEVEELDLSDFEVISLPFEREKVLGTQDQYKIKVGWILFPLVAGHHEIELPKIVYRPNSGRKIKLKIPLQKLTVKSLPSYIPATMPIGEVEIKNSVQAGKLGNLHNTQTLINWNIELITNNVLPETIPPILRQVKASKSLDVFPATSDTKQLKTYTGLQQINSYNVPVKALRSGQLDLPNLSIQYFDPSDGILKRATAQVSTQWALHDYLQWFLLTLILMLMLFLLLKIFQGIQAYRLQRRLINQAISDIKQAEDTQELTTALHNLSQAKGWRANTTLQQLLKNWETQKGQDLVLESIFNELQTIQFSKNAKVSFENVKNGLINSLKQA